MSRSVIAAVSAAALFAALCGCKSEGQTVTEAPAAEAVTPLNSIYFWKTDLSLSEKEREFLKDHDINRMYVRLFDVVSNEKYGAVPNAPINITEGAIPDSIEIVPTVYLTVEALYNMKGREEELAANIYKRINAQLACAKITAVPEIQIDCDWTESSRERFFTLCQSLRKLANDDGRLLSSTIRLHQLTQDAPPVDSGVLMLYNVGNLRDFHETNSILRNDIVKTYLNRANDYPLTLDVAYPIFSWGVCFSGSTFSHLVNLTDPDDPKNGLSLQSNNIYEIGKESPFWQDKYMPMLRFECCPAKVVMEAKQMAEEFIGGRPHRVILYHLDENMISRYTNDEINAIYK